MYTCVNEYYSKYNKCIAYGLNSSTRLIETIACLLYQNYLDEDTN